MLFLVLIDDLDGLISAPTGLMSRDLRLSMYQTELTSDT